MTPQEFMDNFGVLADAPGGIGKLRGLIAALAVSGRLVEGDNSDLVATGLTRAAEDELPCLPCGWRWTDLESVLHALRNGVSTSPKDGGGVRVLRISAVRPNRVNIDDVKHLPGKLGDYEGFTVHEGDLLFTRYSGNAEFVGACGVVPKVTTPTLHPDKLIRGVARKELVDPRFLALAANCGASRKYIDTCTKTTAGQVGISGKQLKGTPVPIPPLAEQKRIVARVDQLMALLDDLEAKQGKRQKTVVRATTACLDALTTADSPEDVADAWKRVAGNWRVLFDRPEAVGDLRKAVLELAVRGRLTRRIGSDESVSSLLDQVSRQRQKALRDGFATKLVVVAEVDGEAPFDIPSAWQWVRWGMLTLYTESGWSPQAEARPRQLPEWGVLKVSAVSWDVFKPDENKALPASTKPPERAVVREGDFLMSRANTSDLVGRSVLVEGKQERLILSDKLVRCEFAPAVNRHFVNYANRTQSVRQHYLTNATGTSDSMKNISRGVILNVPMPLPPRKEQDRIVAKVDALMALCDNLESNLLRRDDRAGKLVTAVVGEMVG